ncbi:MULTISPECIES: head maturation protease, ClpP-related [unclassified Fusobacterium]|uniref:head maturation protease, ClpP-related n=1 Tax=unclassified Fusobacterium TaxID=2648384 RepID=UPI001B8CA7A9|nr:MULTISPECIES: head maturation protease, ClpP-related [unclassified Fusobacterium]MBR8701451.1 ATP-dependent Clp protease proteolytic subunit [Fusobacterium sp. DD45]MBR8711219.1 ATP-dependent Clp protease proteolytic subunit [Fusobacterium sp. DD28]MBR8751788.1 ATP-dependent Clp protease proteolytic subunit [Fusobacterium sp. DD26]
MPYLKKGTVKDKKLTLKIVDVIGKATWWEDTVSYKDILAELEEYGPLDSIEVIINSPGGSVTEGVAIYEALKTHPARVDVKIVGECCSIATVIAMAGDTIQMANTSLFMIHDPIGYLGGNEKDFVQMAELLKKIKDNIINAYITKTHLSREEISELMSNETYLTAEEAKEKGFITDILDHKASKKIMNMRMSALDAYKFQNRKKDNKEEKIVDIKELMEKYPELYNQIKNEGKNEGAVSERVRIEALDKLGAMSASNKANLEIINKAKFETFENAEDIITSLFENLAKENPATNKDIKNSEENKKVVDFEKIKTIVNDETNVGNTDDKLPVENVNDLINEIVDISKEI